MVTTLKNLVVVMLEFFKAIGLSLTYMGVGGGSWLNLS